MLTSHTQILLQRRGSHAYLYRKKHHRPHVAVLSESGNIFLGVQPLAIFPYLSSFSLYPLENLGMLSIMWHFTACPGDTSLIDGTQVLHNSVA